MIEHSLMLHVQVLEARISFALMYMYDHIFVVLSIKDFINENRNSTISFKLATGMKHSLSYLHVVFCPCVLIKDTGHVGTKSLNMCHQAQKGFCGIFLGILQHQK